jgi:hypothetical protein
MQPPDLDDGPTIVFDPLSDLFFSIVAIVVLAVIIILPTVRLEASQPDPVANPRRMQINGVDVTPLRAAVDGVHYGPDGGQFASLSDIADDRNLAASIKRAVAAGVPLVILIDPDGDESAFQLEPLLAQSGVGTVTQVRLDWTCAAEGAARPQGTCPAPAPARPPA